jgi:DNA-binding transcriptional LysR family regulator
VVYDRGVRLLADGEDMVAELDQMRGVKRGTLRIGFPRVGSSALFAPAFASFRRDYPGVDVELETNNPAQLEKMLRSGELDLAAMIQPVPPGLEWQDVRSDLLTVLLPREHPLAGRDAVELADLADSPFIMFEEGLALNDVILDACRSKGIVPNIAVRSGQLDFIFELVAAGVGIAFLPRVIADRRPHPTVRSLLLEAPRCRWRIALAWRTGGYLSHAARAWLACMRGEQATP